jgi:hypothetical protein
MTKDTTTHAHSLSLRLLFVRFSVIATRRGQTTALNFVVTLFSTIAVSFTLHYFGND